MFDINNGRYGNIRIYDKQEGIKTSPFIQIKADLILPKPEKCPYCILFGDRCSSIKSLGMEKEPNKQYGLYQEKPAIYSIFSERFCCDQCRGTFFADHGMEDFNRKKHTLPEFINFMILEWLKDKEISFDKLEQKYKIEGDAENEDHGRSAESIRIWCNQVVDKFDQMTLCDADETLYFSSFHYGRDNPKLYCLVGKIVDEEEEDSCKAKQVKRVSRVCAFLENYDKFNHLEESLNARFNDLSIVERVVYDYYPGLNIAMEKVFNGKRSNQEKVNIIVDSKRLQNNILSRLIGIERTYIEDLDNMIFHSRKDRNYLHSHGTEVLAEWIEDLPDEYQNDIRDYLRPLMEETPQQFNKSIPILSFRPEDYFEDISTHCQKRSGKSERFENMKLRVLYDNKEFKDKIKEIVEEESRRTYEEICKFCACRNPFTFDEFFEALCDRTKYAKLYSSAGTKQAEVILDQYKNYDPYYFLLDPVQKIVNWSVPYFNLAKELEYDDE